MVAGLVGAFPVAPLAKEEFTTDSTSLATQLPVFLSNSTLTLTSFLIPFLWRLSKVVLSLSVTTVLFFITLSVIGF